MSITSTSAPVKDERALVRRLRRQGFEPGVPEHVTEETQATDRRMCRYARCGACRRHGLAWPMSRSRMAGPIAL
jgi:hypothetical protein